MSTTRIAAPLLASVLLSGCGLGLAVPEIQEIPGDVVGGQIFIQEIVNDITCEVGDAINDLYKNRKKGLFLDTWGAQITLNLTVEEKGGLSPNTNWLPPSPANAIFNLSAGVTASSDATRIDKINSYYTVQDFLKRGYCVARGNGPFLLQSDLKLKEWLFDALTVSDTGEINFGNDTAGGVFKQNVFSHEVKFEVLTNGNVTPGWKLTRVSVNQTGSLLSLSRDRIHDLIITFGPSTQTTTVTAVHGKSVRVTTSAPASFAQESHLASEIGVAVSNGVRSALQP